MLPAFLQEFLLNYSYFAVFLILLLCGAGVPLPEDITLLAAGIASALGGANVHIMLLVSYAGILIGDLMMYGLGYRYGHRLLERGFFKRVLHEQRLKQVDEQFVKYGKYVIFCARFLPGLRAPIYVVAGMMRRVSVPLFLLMDGLAALISVPVFVYLGHYGAENTEWLLKKVEEFKLVSFLLLTAFFSYCAIRFYRAYKRRQFYRETRRRLKAEQARPAEAVQS